MQCPVLSSEDEEFFPEESIEHGLNTVIYERLEGKKVSDFPSPQNLVDVNINADIVEESCSKLGFSGKSVNCSGRKSKCHFSYLEFNQCNIKESSHIAPSCGVIDSDNESEISLTSVELDQQPFGNC
ncbi:uncharacterized protein LOC111443083 [Cucurbita moschata]|uniref:Uncharacterized protein LOC111443083 n=1 Tax=Cucurbita moschata TaxID=3662 RepID=A0A6J1F8E3_CUCMO|nr:uncharacterized protein LOC111443083 [Cucurbita moschata]